MLPLLPFGYLYFGVIRSPQAKVGVNDNLIHLEGEGEMHSFRHLAHFALYSQRQSHENLPTIDLIHIRMDRSTLDQKY